MTTEEFIDRVYDEAVKHALSTGHNAEEAAMCGEMALLRLMDENLIDAQD